MTAMEQPSDGTDSQMPATGFLASVLPITDRLVANDICKWFQLVDRLLDV